MNQSLSAVDVAVEQALSVLRESPSALVTDVDGTISLIVNRPEDATVSSAIQRALARLSSQLALVAVITARQESMARRMVQVESLTYVGNYAVEAAVKSAHKPIDISSLLDVIRPLVAANPCVTLEEKGIALSLHYRNCLDKTTRDRLIHLATPAVEAAGAKLVEGKQVLEIVPGDLPDKGSALARLLSNAEVEGVVYLGDDLSDIAAFQEIRRRRDVEGKPSLAIAVVDEETPPSVREAGDLTLAGVPQVTQFLNRLVGGLEGAG